VETRIGHGGQRRCDNNGCRRCRLVIVARISPTATNPLYMDALAAASVVFDRATKYGHFE
jgi:hypothetical protein